MTTFDREKFKEKPTLAREYLRIYTKSLLKIPSEIPEEVSVAGNILSYYGFGFQAPGEGTKDTFVIAKLVADYGSELTERVKMRSSSGTVEIVDFLGRNFLTVKWFEFHLIERILTECIKCGWTFCTHNCLEVHYTPSRFHFTYEDMEIEFVQWFNREAKGEFMEGWLLEHRGRALLNINNWTTDAGIALCKYLKSTFERSESNVESE